MRIFLVVRNDRHDWDEYDSAVVIAESPEEAVEMLKKEHRFNPYDLHQVWGHYDVTVTEVTPDGEPRIVIQSYNAG